MEGLITVDALAGALSLSREQTIQWRSQYIPESCKLHFDKAPVKIVRASGQYLYDDEGMEFLDCVNCVAHVGHCNPTVLEAAKSAMVQMGSVSLGMSDIAQEYVSKLRASLPPEIDTFLFVSSGSEANDVAIQMSRLFTGGYDVVAVERGFHGGLSLTNRVSPREFTNEEKCPEWVHVLQCPDLYRGKFLETDPHAVEKYCQNAKEVMEKAVEKKRKLACFIGEPLFTIGGIITPPSEWIHSVYKDIRAFGGIAIADEAQSGLGRPGSSMWCFQLFDNLVPDIITIATLGTVDATNYLCDQVSAAIGLAVINTVRSQSLQMNARTVGDFLREGIRALSNQHPNIGQVRGTGLMVGVEIVYNPQSRKPARDIAERICYKMLEHYIVVANDGKYKNVLIMTPPMCFTCENAHRVILALDKVLKKIETSDGGQEEEHNSLNLSISGERLLTLDEVSQAVGTDDTPNSLTQDDVENSTFTSTSFMSMD